MSGGNSEEPIEIPSSSDEGEGEENGEEEEEDDSLNEVLVIV